MLNYSRPIDRLEHLYLPLWQLGYSIPLDRVRGALREPLVGAGKELDIQMDGRSAIDDAIDDAGLSTAACESPKVE